MPPVREASTKPSGGDGLAGAGRVLEPEAASGAGVVGRRTLVLVRRLRLGLVVPVDGLLLLRLGLVVLLVHLFFRASSSKSRSSSSSSSSTAGSASSTLSVGAAPFPSSPFPFARPADCASVMSAISVPERASTWWADSSVPSARCGSSCGQEALEPEHQRVLALPGHGRPLATRVDLGDRRVEGSPARRARGQHRGGVLPLEEEGLARELLGTREVGLRNRGGGDQGIGISHAGFSGRRNVRRGARKRPAVRAHTPRGSHDQTSPVAAVSSTPSRRRRPTPVRDAGSRKILPQAGGRNTLSG